MRIAIACLPLLALPLPAACAAFTDFEDLPADTDYVVGQVIQSKGIELEVVAFNFLGNPAKTGGGGVGFRQLNVGPGVDFHLPAGAEEISFDYTDGARVRLAINGVQPANYPGDGVLPPHAGFSFLNGTSLGGVNVSTTTSLSQPDGEIGVLTLADRSILLSSQDWSY